LSLQGLYESGNRVDICLSSKGNSMEKRIFQSVYGEGATIGKFSTTRSRGRRRSFSQAGKEHPEFGCFREVSRGRERGTVGGALSRERGGGPKSGKFHKLTGTAKSDLSKGRRIRSRENLRGLT